MEVELIEETFGAIRLKKQTDLLARFRTYIDDSAESTAQVYLPASDKLRDGNRSISPVSLRII